MSIALMTKVWESAMPTNTHKLVLLAFADHANDEGVCWPSLDRIALRSQMSRRQVQRVVADLRKVGLLEVLEQANWHRSPTYQIRGDILTPLLESGVTSEQPGVTSEHVRGDTHDAGLHIKESSLEPSEESGDFFEKRYETARGRRLL